MADSHYPIKEILMSIAALVLGIISVLIGFSGSFAWVGIITGIIGIILGVLGKKNEQPGQHGMAVAGLVLSIIGTIWAAVWYIACIACAGVISSFF